MHPTAQRLMLHEINRAGTQRSDKRNCGLSGKTTRNGPKCRRVAYKPKRQGSPYSPNFPALFSRNKLQVLPAPHVSSHAASIPDSRPVRTCPCRLIERKSGATSAPAFSNQAWTVLTGISDLPARAALIGLAPAQSDREPVLAERSCV